VTGVQTCALPISRSAAPERSSPEIASGASRPLHKGYIDISTGLYVREDDDLVLDTPMVVVLRRTYQSGDHRPRRFGISTSHPGEWWLSGNGDPAIPWADLTLANGVRLHFTRISPGNTQEGAVLRHDGLPPEFEGAILRWNGSRWEMQLRDGSSALFVDCQNENERCSLIERRDASGHRVEYVRNAADRLVSIESDGRSISFDYDEQNRIVRAYDTDRRSVSYRYDDRGRLVTASASDGTTRTYAYNGRDELLMVREPGRIVQNWFDDRGRVVRQEVRSSDDDDDPYVVTVRYILDGESVIQTDLEENNLLTRQRYNHDHFMVSETLDPEGITPVTFAYQRDSVTNAVTTATMSCVTLSGSATRKVPIEAQEDDELKWDLVRENCAFLR